MTIISYDFGENARSVYEWTLRMPMTVHDISVRLISIVFSVNGAAKFYKGKSIFQLLFISIITPSHT